MKPREQLYGLTVNCGDAEFARFCSIAMGSASELEYHLLVKDLKLINPKDHGERSQRATELKRMLTALFQKLNADRSKLRSSRFQVWAARFGST